MIKLRTHAITVIVAAAVALGWMFVWFVGTKGTPFEDKYKIRAQVPSAVALIPNSSVKIDGVKVGKVTSIDRAVNGVTLGLELDADDGPIPIDSRVGVRLRTLVGENYVSLYPGRSNTMLREGGTLAMSQANDYVETDQILSVLRGETRERARDFIQGLGGGVRNRGDKLNRFVYGAAGTIEEGSAILRLLRNDRRRVARLIDDFGDVARAVGERRQAVRGLASGLEASFKSIASRHEDLRSILEQMPATLRQVRRTSQIVRAVTGDAAPVLSNLAAAVQELDPSVKLLYPTAQQARGAVRELGRAALPLRSTLAQLNRLAPPLVTALPHVRRTLCELNPAVKFITPYSKDIAAFGGTFASATNAYDGVGHVTRLGAIVGKDALAGAWTEPMAKAAETLVQAGIFDKLGGRNGYNPLPGPGGADDLQTGLGSIGPTDAPLPYTRVTAEC